MRVPLAFAAALFATAAFAQGGATQGATHQGPATQAPATGDPATVSADLRNAAGQKVGAVVLTAAPKGVLMRVEAHGLSPGWHGLHFHAKADCSKADFTSAGPHVHGDAAAVHGLLNENANETGDLPNIHAAQDGNVSAEVFSTLVTLKGLQDADGSAVVIHADADDHTAQPIGGAGPRVACAEVK